MVQTDPAVTALLIGIILGYVLGVGQSREQQDCVEEFLENRLAEVKDEYAETTVDDEEWLAEEILLLEDPGTERIMRDAVDVEGIGPDRAYCSRCLFSLRQLAGLYLE